MKIYYCGSIRGGRDKAELYRMGIAVCKEYGTVLTEHIGSPALTKYGGDGTDAEIYARDTAWLRECDIVIADCSVASLGVGYEIGMAEALGKPVHILYSGERLRLSAMLAGNSGFAVHLYENEEEMTDVLRGILESFPE